MLTVQDVYDFINERAPFDTQADFDNSGLLVGSPAAAVHHIHVAMDCTEAVAQEAAALGADLIVTHHPVMFSPRKTLREDDPEARLLCRLIRGGQALIAAHTSLDQAPGGINDVLAAAIGLEDVTGEGFLRVGNLPAAMTPDALAQHLAQRLHTVVRPMGPAGRSIRRVGVCSGAGSDCWAQAAEMGAVGFVSGEIRHHHALAASEARMVCFECGHHATEEPGIFALADALQNWPDAVQWKVRVTKSRLGAYQPWVRPLDGEDDAR